MKDGNIEIDISILKDDMMSYGVIYNMDITVTFTEGLFTIISLCWLLFDLSWTDANSYNTSENLCEVQSVTQHDLRETKISDSKRGGVLGSTLREIIDELFDYWFVFILVVWIVGLLLKLNTVWLKLTILGNIFKDPWLNRGTRPSLHSHWPFLKHNI